MAANTTKKQQSRKSTSGSTKSSTKSTASKRSAGTKTGTRSQTQKSPQNTKRTQSSKNSVQTDNKILKEALVLIMIAFSLILFITNFGVGGVVGEAVSSFFFGLFGLVAYVFPIVLIVGGLLLVSNYKNSVIRIKLITSFVIMILL